MSLEHSAAGRELAEHAQTFAEFMEQQKKNRSKVTTLSVVVRFSGLSVITVSY